MKQAVYPNVAFKDYLAIPAVSNSYLGRLDKCPAKAKVEQGETPSLILGRAVHKMVLEGVAAFTEDFATVANCDKRTKEGKAIWAEVVEQANGKQILSFDDHQKITEIYRAVKSHPFASKLLSETVTEQTVIWTDTETGLPCKARPDAVPDEGKMILTDLKSTADADEFAFTRSIVKYGYARQGAFYIDGYNAVRGTKIDSFIVIAVETEAPFRTEVYLLNDDFIRYGREEYRRLLRIEKQCRETNFYPHYQNQGITQIFKPNYL